MAKKFTKDPVDIAMTKVMWLYGIYKESGEHFPGKTEYEVLREIIDVIEMNNPVSRKKVNLKIVPSRD